MPTMATITIKKNDGTTDAVYTAIVASGGDKSPALWRYDAAPGYPGQKPKASVSSRDNGDKTARRIEGTFSYPSVYTDTATSTTKVLGTAICNFSCVLPMALPTADQNEFGAQLGNFLASALIKSVNQTGYAPA
ncbi:TPA_asm: coat protein [ssRNA phage Esthiorhiza.2_36]|jgi:hypothetical protein|uniref:Coat protein n=2 Tax=Fiersviridae TaxID=2842319 RepID=A0A8S5KYD8_9VIRU|nr:coat protein [ssRNA phage Esthiorhiza.2_36]QDH87428.1 MAG: hypothetical protein H2RhizoLitter492430_000003 [Leviviridae sp.]DAD50180.1 TPA_asm: coat protein [ssRNA phage Esthiorhiza.2_36]